MSDKLGSERLGGKRTHAVKCVDKTAFVEPDGLQCVRGRQKRRCKIANELQRVVEDETIDVKVTTSFLVKSLSHIKYSCVR